jgi:hypothetical protein
MPGPWCFCSLAAINGFHQWILVFPVYLPFGFEKWSGPMAFVLIEELAVTE